MNNETLQTLLAMVKAASDDQTRYRLTAVLLQVKNYGKLKVLEAHVTDGHIACKRTLPDSNLCEVLKTGDSFLVFPDVLKSLKSMAGKTSVLPCTRVDDSKIEFSLGGQSILVPINDQEAKTYPVDQMAGFYKTERKSPIRVTFNAELLESLLQAMREDKRQCGVTIEFDAANLNTCIGVSVQGGESGFNGVLMPMRGDKANQENNDATLKQGSVA